MGRPLSPSNKPPRYSCASACGDPVPFVWTRPPRTWHTMQPMRSICSHRFNLSQCEYSSQDGCKFRMRWWALQP
eukprot:1707047-Amphidinium_carterae.1